MAFIVGIIPTLFQPVGSGSHLYPANLHTLRLEVSHFWRLESLTRSRGRSLSFGSLPLPSVIIIAHLVLFVKSFFKVFFIFFWKEVRVGISSLLLVYYYLIPNLVSLYSVPLFSALPLSIIIIAHLVLFVKSFLKIFSKNFGE